MQRILDIQGFSWWESDDIIKWPTNSFYSGENVEVRKDLSSVQLSPLLEDTGWVFDDDISYMVNLETLWVQNGGIVVCLDNGKIFLDWVLKETLDTWTNAHNEVIGISVNENLSWTQYVYYITATTFGAWKIFRSETDLDTADFTSFSRDYTVSSWNTGFVWIINQTGLVYIATANKVFLMESDEIVQEFLILPEQEDIKWFTEFQGQFKIYTTVVNTGVQYVWDWVSEAPSYRQEWNNQPVLWVVNDWAYDYAVLGFNRSYSNLYEIAGTQKRLLRANLSTANYSRRLDKYLSIRDWLIYISGGQSGQSENYWIYTYGNYFPWTPRSLVQSVSLWTDAFLHHAHNISVSYFACADDKVYKISQNNPPDDYAASGYVVTNMYQWYLWEEKAFDYMKVWFKLNGWEIKIYARTEMSLSSETAWKLIKTLDDANYWDKRYCRIDANELNNNSVWLWTFNELQMKFELTPNGSGSMTPLLWAVTTWLKVINDK